MHKDTEKQNHQNSQTVFVNLEMVYKIEFMYTIRRHHVYKTAWASVINEKLDCKKGGWEENLSHNKDAVGVFRKNETLVGYIPI